MNPIRAALQAGPSDLASDRRPMAVRSRSDDFLCPSDRGRWRIRSEPHYRRVRPISCPWPNSASQTPRTVWQTCSDGSKT